VKKREEYPIQDNMAKVPVFSGKKSDFPMWWSKFKALAAQRKFAKAITEKGGGLPTSSNDGFV